MTQLRQMHDEIKEVNKVQLEVIRRLETSQHRSNTSDMRERIPNTYSAQRNYQWTQEGKPICKRCSRGKHVAQNCKLNQPYQKPFKQL